MNEGTSFRQTGPAASPTREQHELMPKSSTNSKTEKMLIMSKPFLSENTFHTIHQQKDVQFKGR